MEFRPAIMDIEASGFGPGSYPIEVGYCLESGEKFCTLIRPCKHWQFWDASAEKLHNLSRQLLMDVGRTPLQVANQLNERLEGLTLYSDAWSIDSKWLAQLFAIAATTPRFKLSAIEHIQSECQYFKWDSVKKNLALSFSKPRHRASVDAAFIQQVYLQTQMVCQKELKHA